MLKDAVENRAKSDQQAVAIVGHIRRWNGVRDGLSGLFTKIRAQVAL
jgi:hypothetical protein